MQIQKINKNNLDLIASINLTMDSSEAIIISNSTDASKTSSEILQFTITPTQNQVPYLNQEDYSIVIREKVDLSVSGPYERTIADESNDSGKKNNTNSYPYVPRGLTADFIELKGENS